MRRVCNRQPRRPPLETAFSGTPKRRRRLFSTATATPPLWQPAFDAIGRSRHFRVILMARLGCTVTDIVQGLAWLGFTADPGCATFRTNAFKYISTLNMPRVFIAQLHRYPRAPGNVVISAATWNAATARSLNKLRSVSSSLTWLIGVPSPPTTGGAGSPGMPSTCLAVLSINHYWLPFGLPSPSKWRAALRRLVARWRHLRGLRQQAPRSTSRDTTPLSRRGNGTCVATFTPAAERCCGQ
mgnify:CR=1 FL=1